MKNTLWFVILLGITLSGEGIITVSLSWSVLEKNGSILHLGIILSLMSIIPPLLQSKIGKLNNFIKEQPLRVFSLCRTVGATGIILILLLGDLNNVLVLYSMAGFFSIIIFMSLQSLETFMSQKVLQGEITSQKGSSILQAAIQFGAFGGNAIGGVILSIFGFFGVLVALVVSLSVGVLIPALANNAGGRVEQSTTDRQKEVTTSIAHKVSSHPYTLMLLVFGIGMLTVQLASFNFSIPIIFHDIRNWNASTYGFVSAAAGVGALLATLIIKENQFFKFIFIGIIVSNLFLSFTSNWYIAVLFALFLGFSLNSTRIIQRKLMFDFISNKDETVLWARRATLATQFTKSSTPLLLAFITQYTGKFSSPYIFTVVGAVVVTTMFFIIFNTNREHIPIQNKAKEF